KRPRNRPARGRGLERQQLPALRALPPRRPADVHHLAAHHRGAARGLCAAGAQPLGVGGAHSGGRRPRRGWPAAVRRRHGICPHHGPRAAHRPRGRVRHWRPGPHGRHVPQQDGLRRHRLHLQPAQNRGSPPARGHPHGVEYRQGRAEKAGPHLRPAAHHGQPRHQAPHRALPHEPGQRRHGPPARRQSPLPHRARQRPVS
nr:hypothetical protein [Tanacetum cinerariifolium]